MTVVLFKSHTGSTEKYATSFAREMGFECHSVDEKLEIEDDVIFFGWLRGPTVVGLSSVDRTKLRAIAVVALDSEPEFGWNKVRDSNRITVPMYTLRGWIDRRKLHIHEKIFFCFLCAMMKLKGLDSHSQQMFDAMMDGGSFYDESGLEPLKTFCRS